MVVVVVVAVVAVRLLLARTVTRLAGVDAFAAADFS